MHGRGVYQALLHQIICVLECCKKSGGYILIKHAKQIPAINHASDIVPTTPNRHSFMIEASIFFALQEVKILFDYKRKYYFSSPIGMFLYSAVLNPALGRVRLRVELFDTYYTTAMDIVIIALHHCFE